MRGWPALGLFWVVVIAVGGLGALALALLGPPQPRPPNAQGAAPAPARVAILAPDPRLLEPAPDFAGHFLPRTGPTGQPPRLAYAANPGPNTQGPRLAIIVAGLGLSQSDSQQAIAALPSAVDFAVSAYADNPDALLAQMRATGHEYLLSLPMEPANYPQNDEGAHQLLTGAPEQQNALNLEWALSRMTGYAGVTGASDGQYGQRFAELPGLMTALGAELAARGLFYVSPIPGAPPLANVPALTADVAIDAAAGPQAIDAALTTLKADALHDGAAIGLLSRPTPVAVARLAAFTPGLTAASVRLVPASALLAAPTP
jgi:polysaccharide deacetylase 2 family uncharacterized protein YibQ